jgi:hypothetical protein
MDTSSKGNDRNSSDKCNKRNEYSKTARRKQRRSDGVGEP